MHDPAALIGPARETDGLVVRARQIFDLAVPITVEVAGELAVHEGEIGSLPPQLVVLERRIRKRNGIDADAHGVLVERLRGGILAHEQVGDLARDDVRRLIGNAVHGDEGDVLRLRGGHLEKCSDECRGS
ncbi:MAG TPA: hypothetical protein VED01_22390 [Burkholderiales bacterium]|nr:hypothetical protein [Burkholderiales bacterium]